MFANECRGYYALPSVVSARIACHKQYVYLHMYIYIYNIYIYIYMYVFVC